MIASAVTTPQPPAVVSTTTFGPVRQRLGGERGGGLERLLDVAARVIPACRHSPSNTLSSAASAPVWLAAALAPPSVAPPLTSDQRLARGGAARRSSRRPPVRDALDVGEADRGARVVGVVVEVVGDRDGGGVACRHGRLMPTPVCRA